jgi:hypothetical protein
MRPSTAKLFKLALTFSVCVLGALAARIFTTNVGYLHAAIIKVPPQTANEISLQWPDEKIELPPLEPPPLKTDELRTSIDQ